VWVKEGTAVSLIILLVTCCWTVGDHLVQIKRMSGSTSVNEAKFLFEQLDIYTVTCNGVKFNVI
jgi:hypothetical protein